MDKPSNRLDYPITFEDVRLAQHMRFRALSPAQKIAALEDMEKLAAMVRKNIPQHQ